MKYFSILADSFNIVWRHKTIWALGMLMALCGQIGALPYTLYIQLINPRAIQAASPAIRGMLQAIIAGWPRFLLIYFAVHAILWVLAVLAETPVNAALIHLIHQAETDSSVPIRPDWQVAKARFRPLFLISLLLGLPRLVLNLPPIQAPTSNGVPAAIGFSTAAGWLCCAGWVVFLAFLILIEVQALAARACVLDDMDVRDSLRRGGRLARRNLGAILIIFLLLMFIAVPSAIPGAIVMNLLVPRVIRAMIAGEWSGPAAVTLLFSLVVFVGVNGLLAGFEATVSNRLYRVFREREAEAPALGMG
jgi:hypothetical protein